jgi:hypothetical protein
MSIRASYVECQNLGGFLGVAKRHQALMHDRPRFKGESSEVLATTTGYSTRMARRARHGGRLDNILRGQLPGAQARGEGQDVTAAL